MDNIMVSVICNTYNHEKYIGDAIKGIVNQKTDFKFELLIHDDASTDHNADIIREYEKKYPDIIRATLEKENQLKHCHITRDIAFPQARGKYIAFCEGDDYWTDMEKLQKQVDFLEKHEDYSMCLHNAVMLDNETGEKRVLDTFPKDGTYSQEEQISAGMGSDFPAFASYMIRSDLLKNIPDFVFEGRVLDYPLRQYYANCGKVYYFEKPMSVYRVSVAGSYMKSCAENQQFYHTYTLEMINFFEKFNKYTNKKFDSLIQKKLMSDYMGYCLSVSETEGMKKALEKGLDVKRIKDCYERLSEEYLDIGIKQVCKRADRLFIYGTSRIALRCKKQLDHAGIEFEGFVVSDGRLMEKMVEHKRVYYLSRVIAEYENPGFILAVQPANVGVLEEMMKKNHLDNYCKPYFLS